MSKYGHKRSLLASIVSSALLVTSSTASAFAVKHTASGQVVRWFDSNVPFVMDATVAKAAGGGAQAVTSAVGAWGGSQSAPALSVSQVSGDKGPAVDGINTIVFAADGFVPAGGALAVTLLSFDDKTGSIVDADIVINGQHGFAVLDAAVRAPSGTEPVSNEAASGRGSPSDSEASPKFDLQHVVTHEVGHALGLGDVTADSLPVMYAYSTPGDASGRSPTSDDREGISEIYAPAAGAAAGSGGCGGASVAGARVGGPDSHHGLAALALILVGATWLASRRRDRAFRGSFVPLTAGLVLVSGAESRVPVRPAAMTSVAADARARVTSATTTNTRGAFETVLELAPRGCRASPCPERVRAHVWGGTLNGITQQVGELPAPRVDDDVDIAIVAPGSEGFDASVLAVRPLIDRLALPYR